MPPVGVQQAKSNLDLFNNPYIICIANCLTFNLTCVLWPIEFVKLDYVSSIEFSIYMLNDPHDTIFIPGKCVNRIFDLPGSLPILFLIGIPEIHFTFHEASNVIFPNESKFLAIISSVFFSYSSPQLVTCLCLCLGLPQIGMSYTYKTFVTFTNANE